MLYSIAGALGIGWLFPIIMLTNETCKICPPCRVCDCEAERSTSAVSLLQEVMSGRPNLTHGEGGALCWVEVLLQGTLCFLNFKRSLLILLKMPTKFKQMWAYLCPLSFFLWCMCIVIWSYGDVIQWSILEWWRNDCGDAGVILCPGVFLTCSAVSESAKSVFAHKT